MSSINLPMVTLSGLERHGTPYTDDNGDLYVTLPERLRYEDRDDTITHLCKGGERLFDLAIIYYRDMYQSPVDYWEVIAEFQPDPIIDPSVPFKAGDIVLIPSAGYNETVAFGDSLTDVPAV